MKTQIERFESKYIKDESGCWLWTASASNGYGKFSVRISGGKYITTIAHRFSYELYVGPIPEGFQIDHLCRTTLCVNPVHLEAVSGVENAIRRGAVIARCPKGHEYSDENTLRFSTRPNRRYCKTCARERNKEYRLRKKQEGLA